MDANLRSIPDSSYALHNPNRFPVNDHAHARIALHYARAMSPGRNRWLIERAGRYILSRPNPQPRYRPIQLKPLKKKIRHESRWTRRVIKQCRRWLPHILYSLEILSGSLWSKWAGSCWLDWLPALTYSWRKRAEHAYCNRYNENIYGHSLEG